MDQSMKIEKLTEVTRCLIHDTNTLINNNNNTESLTFSRITYSRITNSQQ